ncbi:MAG: FAD-dependent monooxygenase [Leptospirales bacterium]|nr:FAD-dependent monooxygenase [Leptospirales bacterium]
MLGIYALLLIQFAVKNAPGLIVGAGPTGLTLANLLARNGVSFRLLDRNAGPGTQSRALVVHARTLELFRSIGLADRAIARGRKSLGILLHANGRRVAQIDIGAVRRLNTPYPFVLILSQADTENILLEGLAQTAASVDWNCELLKVAREGDGFAVEYRNAAGIHSAAYPWLIAADGARSVVRHQLGLPFEGGSYEQSFVLADAELSGYRGGDRLSFFLTAQGPAAVLPMAGDLFRIISIVRENEIGDHPSAAEVEKLLQMRSLQPDLRVLQAHWISVYRIHHRRIASFQMGNCFFAGDAAHIHSPAGGQGMNTGIQDAWNLAWKLAFVLRGLARPQLLESYHAERFPAAEDLLRTTDALFSGAVRGGAVGAWLRLFVFPRAAALLSRIEALRRRVIWRLSQLAIHYRGGPLSSGQGSFRRQAPAPGDRMPSGEIVDGEGKSLDLLDLAPPAHMLLLCYEHQAGPTSESFAAAVRSLSMVRPVHLRKAAVDAADSFRVSAALDRRLQLQEGAVLLVRPDGYIGFRSSRPDATALLRYLDQIGIIIGQS